MISKAIKSNNSKRWMFQGAIGGLLLLAFAIRVYNLASVPLSLDEAVTIRRYIATSLLEIFTTYHSNNHTLASALAHLFSPQADNLFMMRWPSVLIGLIALPFIYRLGTGLFNRWIGLLTLGLVALTPVYIGYSVIVRGYVGLISLTTIALYFLWRSLQTNRWQNWLTFILLSIIVPFFHLFSVVAISLLLGLVGLWLLGQSFPQRGDDAPSRFWPKQTVIRFGVAVVIVLGSYGLLIYARTTSVLAEGGYAGDFEIWRDGVSSLDDLLPLKIFIDLMAPMSWGGIAAYLFLIFWAIGLWHLWQQQLSLALAVIIWFLAPPVLIYGAMQLFGTGFYAYVRFLLYLLPTYLLLVAIGMMVCFRFLSKMEKSGQIVVRFIKWGTVAAVLVMMGVSTNWYLVRATNTDWLGMTQTLVRELDPEDVTICEEYRRGYEIPDRSKPYCVWMIESATNLEAYTHHLQSTTDFVTLLPNLQKHREQMVNPGGVWLVVWQKIIFNVEHLITDQKPEAGSFVESLAEVPYETWHFGSASLIHINTEETLLGNIYKSLELLLILDQTPADRARYYRSMAELEAFQGHKQAAQAYKEQSWKMIEVAGGVYPEQFLGDVESAIVRIPQNTPPSTAAYPAGYKFGPALCLQAYEISANTLQAGHKVTLTFYWQTLSTVDEDYKFFLSLAHETGQSGIRLEFEPFNHTYPTPWWWPGQRLVDHHEFLIPGDMPAQDYLLQLGAFDRQTRDQEISAPLFLLSSESSEVDELRWLVEETSSTLPRCS